jgi:hypothetical protein
MSLERLHADILALGARMDEGFRDINAKFDRILPVCAEHTTGLAVATERVEMQCNKVKQLTTRVEAAEVKIEDLREGRAESRGMSKGRVAGLSSAVAFVIAALAEAARRIFGGG